MERLIITVFCQNNGKDISIGSYRSRLWNLLYSVFSQTPFDQREHAGFQAVKNDVLSGERYYNLQLSCLHRFLWHCDIISHRAAFLIGSLGGEVRSWMSCCDWTDRSTDKLVVDKSSIVIDHLVPPKWCWKVFVQKCQEIAFSFLNFLAYISYQSSSDRTITNGTDFLQE